MIVTNINEDSRFKKENIPRWESDSFLDTPLLGVPIKSRGNVLGVLNVAEKLSGESFTEREQVVLSVLAGQAAIAIENAGLYSQLEKRIETLKQTINKLNQTQNQLIQTEKLAAVGRLAFGIAHEIRNPLGIIMGGVEFLGNIINKKDPLTVESIQKIEKSIMRANDIIVDLLKFARASELDLKPVNICALLKETVPLFRNKANLSSVEVKCDFPKNSIKVNADHNMLSQALFNLCANAIDAMENGGELRLSVRREECAETKSNNAIIEIADTGKGISEDELSKIFDPFFTTKMPGEGIGLGLSIVHLILERHNASINAESKIGEGTKFTITLPAAK